MSHETAARNTDRELWRETPEDFYSPSLHVTETGGIGINVGGRVYVKPLRSWHELVDQTASLQDRVAVWQEVAEQDRLEIFSLKEQTAALLAVLKDTRAWMRKHLSKRLHPTMSDEQYARIDAVIAKAEGSK